MSKSKNRRSPTSRRSRDHDQAADALYQRARGLAALGHADKARSIYADLSREGQKPNLRALALSDLAALAAAAGDVTAARRGFEAALSIDDDCEAARDNLAMLDGPVALPRGELQPALATAMQTPVPTTPDESRMPCKVAVLSLLFNWPTSGGGNVHTVELAKFLARAGYDVRHYFARFEPWGIGRVDEAPPFPSECLAFDEDHWTTAVIQARFRQSVERFDPDYVIISDSWNFKPLLAEAVRDYPFFLRLQALECLCPLNNVRLLPGGQQCPNHQLATPEVCHHCLVELGDWSGPLHRAERSLCRVGSAEYDRVLRWAMGAAQAVLVVNPLTEAMLGPYARQVRVVPSGFDPQRFPWPWPAEADPPANGKTAILIAAVAQEGIKGFEVLHAACAKLWEQRQDFELLATSDPPGPVDAFTRNVGWQSQADLPWQMRAAHIVVVPAVAQEALGRTAVEAMAVGRPVVASRIGGLPYTVADGAGLLVEHGNIDDLAGTLTRLLDDPQLREQMGCAG